VLDKRPDVFKDKTGKVRGQARRILADRSPEAFFFENDLYTIRWLGREDDVIERMLFGAIDAHGAIATRAWLDEDMDVIHQTYGQVYEFMDALRLRTPPRASICLEPNGVSGLRAQGPRQRQVPRSQHGLVHA
jgi:hypothetical protein